MKEIRCSDLGHPGCGWKAVSATEDKLADYVAVHARDHHGIKNFTQEMIAAVKNKASAPVGEWAGTGDEPLMRQFNCPDCSWRYIAQTGTLIADAAAVHARDSHGVKEFTNEMVAKVKNSLRDWTGA